MISMTHEIELNNDMFENIKHIDENGREYWSARELMEKLQYSKWQNFYKVIKNSITSCKIAIMMLMNTLLRSVNR